MLVESIDDHQGMTKFKYINDMPVEKRKAEGSLYLDDIIKALNGYGRIIQYRVYGDSFTPDNCSIEFVQEGRFKQGLMDGYNRMFDGREDGYVQLGYFQDGVPKGRYQSFSIEGDCLQEGIKEGEEDFK